MPPGQSRQSTSAPTSSTVDTTTSTSNSTTGVGNQARQDAVRDATTSGGGGGSTPPSGGSGGATNPNAGAGPQCGVDDPSAPPFDRLQTAVTCGDATIAMNAFSAFGASDNTALAADTGLLGQFVTLEPDTLGPGILRQVAPSEYVRFDIANSALSGTPAAIQEVLWDLGARDPRTLAPFIPRLILFTSIANRAVLGPILARGSAADAAAAFDDDQATMWLRIWFTGDSPLAVLPQLATDGAALLAAFPTAPFGQVWLLENPTLLGQKIPTWNAVADWFRAIQTATRTDALIKMINANAAAWGPGLRDAFNAQGAGALAPIGPADPLGFAVLVSVAAVDHAAAGRLTQTWAWPIIIALPMALAGGWLDRDSVLAMTAGPTATIDTQAAIASSTIECALVQLTGVTPWEAFPLLVADAARLTAAARTNAVLLTWLVADPVRLKAEIERSAQFPPWAKVLVEGGQIAHVLRFAKDHGADWKAAVDSQTLFPAVLAALPARMPDEDSFRGFFNLWGDGTGRTGAEAVTAFTHLAAARVMPAGEETIFDNYSSINDPNAVAGSPNVYDLVAVWMPVAPSDAAMLEMMRMLAPMSLNEVAATRTLAFVNNKVFRWKQTAPTASTTWHDFVPAASGQRDLGTSYAWAGNVVMYAPATLGGAPNPGGMDTTPADSDSRGVGRMVGGGQQQGRWDNRTLGNQSLTYFQNHARHEFGHSVGASTYNGMATGDASAQTWAGWTQETDAQFTAAMWSASGSVRLNVGTPPTRVDVPAADIGAWATTLLKSGAEPGPGNVLVDNAAFTGVSADDKLTLLRASRVGHQALLKYLNAVRDVAGSFTGVPNSAYQFTGYIPAGADVHIYASRWGDSFAKYGKDAYDAMIRSHGWYSLSSPAEMFAEIYTKHYSGGAAPRELRSVNWDSWFSQLEAAGPATTPSGPGAQATDPTAGATGVAAAAEVAPSSAIIDTV